MFAKCALGRTWERPARLCCFKLPKSHQVGARLEDLFWLGTPDPSLLHQGSPFSEVIYLSNPVNCTVLLRVLQQHFQLEPFKLQQSCPNQPDRQVSLTMHIKALYILISVLAL